jgi:hypothetical protein
MTRTSPTPGIPPTVVITGTSGDSRSPKTSPIPLTSDVTLARVKTERVSTSLSSPSRVYGSPPALDSSGHVVGSNFIIVEDLESDSETELMIGKEDSTRSSSDSDKDSSGLINYSVPDFYKDFVNS